MPGRVSVALDACVMIEAMLEDHRPGRRPGSTRIHPSDALLLLAETGEFDLLIFDIALAQALGNLTELQGSSLQSRLQQANARTYRSPDAKVLKSVYLHVEPRLTSAIRDVHDFEIGACIYLTQPDYFISSNHADFNQAMEVCFGGVVLTPKQFLQAWRSMRPDE